MENINWNDALALAQILVIIGALGGQILWCFYILAAEMTIAMFIGVPFMAFWFINSVLGEEAAFIAALLVFAFIAWYFYMKKRLDKKVKDLYGNK